MIMKKVLIILLLPTLFLASCQNGSLIGLANPISNNDLGGAISTWGILDSAVIAYRGLPRCTITNNFSVTHICYKRSVLVTAQAYDNTANMAINKAVSFQRNNPTLDASSYISAAVTAVNTFKAFAQKNNLPGAV